jgi:hypothetical protein
MIHSNQTFKQFFEMISNNPAFFVDFDETLVSSNRVNKFNDELQELIDDQDVNKYLFEDRGQNWVSFLRPHAIEFLNELKKLGNVYILTAGAKEFQLPIKKYFHMPISDDHVFGPNQYFEVPYFKNAFLIDNLHFHASDIIDKLTVMGHAPEYSDQDNEYIENDRHIQVKPFYYQNIGTDNELVNVLNFIQNYNK